MLDLRKINTGLKRFREEFEREGVGAFAYMEDVAGNMAKTITALQPLSS